MRVDTTLVRSGQWWDHKIPPIIAAAALTMTAAPSLDGVAVLWNLILFLAATIGVAAFGHVVNDLADIRTDELAGAPNQMAPLSVGARSAVLGATIVVGGLPWIWLPHSARVLVLVGIEVGLLTVYSVRPIRLKDRSSAGALTDAMYAYVVPIALTIAVFTELGGAAPPGWSVMVPVLTWMLLMGFRGILWHQIGDLAHDRRSGVRTLATRIGAERSGTILGWMVVIEFAVAATSLTVIASTADMWWPPAFGVLYLLYRVFQMSILWTDPLLPTVIKHHNGRIRYLGFVILNEFVERWLPVAALVALAIEVPLMWAALVVHLLLFDNAVFEFLRRDLRELPDALNRLAHEGKSRRHIRRVMERRRTQLADGPMPLPPEMRKKCRWVFVVCGPELHIETLATAVRNLRPLTQLEIWVLTDSSRNVRPIQIEGVDNVVDVDTPAEMDDHQASIWLKTGVHRHLPAGEWCYLDSDIIAVRPGVEKVFSHRTGPVAFASDLTISANQVDRFSPWAMNCDCSGHGDTHSCSHLREQLEARFGLDVPGDWVHWNGGVFLFGPDSTEFLDLWNERACASFNWPEWRTRDQGALISTAWTLGLQNSPRIPAQFNFIADLGNGDLCLDPERGWALHPGGPWVQAHMLHLYTSRLEDPEWDLGRDVEAPVIRQTLVRTLRWRRFEVGQRAKDEYWATKGRLVRFRYEFAQGTRNLYWRVRFRIEVLAMRIRRQPRRFHPARIRASIARHRSHVKGADPS